MRAVVISKPGRAAVAEITPPQTTAPTDVLIRTLAVGICGSDVGIFRGKSPFVTYPRIPGHELAGEVVAVGRDVTHIAPGARVVVDPVISCGSCYACRVGRANCCANLRVVGVHVDGGMAEYLAVNRKQVYPVSNSLPPHLAVMCEPMSIGLQACVRGRICEDDKLVIIGAGSIGLMVLLAAKAKGAQVLISDIVPYRLQLAEEFGADRTVNSQQSDLFAAVSRFTDGEGASVVIEAVGAPSTISQAFSLACAAGRVVILGITNQSIEFPLQKIIGRELDVYGSRVNNGLFPQAIEMVERHQSLLAKLVNEIVDFHSLDDATRIFLDRPGEAGKLVVTTCYR